MIFSLKNLLRFSGLSLFCLIIAFFSCSKDSNQSTTSDSNKSGADPTITYKLLSLKRLKGHDAQTMDSEDVVVEDITLNDKDKYTLTLSGSGADQSITITPFGGQARSSVMLKDSQKAILELLNTTLFIKDSDAYSVASSKMWSRIPTDCLPINLKFNLANNIATFRCSIMTFSCNSGIPIKVGGYEDAYLLSFQKQ